MLLDKPLDNILGQSSKIKILRFLIKSQAQLNGREVAKALNLSHVNTHKALRELFSFGIVNMLRTGRSVVYWLNEEHLLVKNFLRPLFEKEASLNKLLVNIIVSNLTKPLPLSMILFGSFAKGTASPASDIDILIVYSDNKDNRLMSDELSRVEKQITSLFGNHLAALPLKLSEFKTKFKKKDRFLKEVIEFGKVIYGRNIPELINYGLKKD